MVGRYKGGRYDGVWAARHQVARELLARRGQPAADACEIMALVDGLTLPQRRLVHEYGFVLALHVLRDTGGRVPEARRLLERVRAERQARLLVGGG